MTINCLLLYADPGSGALIWQLIVAALIGGAFYLRRFKERFFSFWKSPSPQNDQANSDKPTLPSEIIVDDK